MSSTGPHGVLARLGALDPARDFPEQPGSAQDAALRHIMDSPQQVATGDLVPKPRSGPMAAASVLLAVVLVVGTVVWNLSSAPAFATWTEQPQQVSAQQERLVQQHCPMVAHEIVGGAEDPQVQQMPLEPVLIDVRGDYAYVIGTDEQGRYAECFLTRTDGNGVDVVTSDAGAGTHSAQVASAPARGVDILHSGTASWSQGARGLPGELTSAFGRAADDVADVVLHTESGAAVHATVQNGWWAAWAPGGESFGNELTVVATDGDVRHQDLGGSGS